MRSPFRARGLPAETYASWRDSVDRQPGAQVRILAWARGQDGFVVGSPAVLSMGGVAAPPVPARSGVGRDTVRRGTERDVAGRAGAEELGREAPGADGVEAGRLEDDAVGADAAETGRPEDGGVGADAVESEQPDEDEQPDEGADAPLEGDTWRHVAWHRIEHGGWNAESRSLSWTLYGGRRGRVGLAEPGRLPELFRERVAASIVVERFVPIRGERGVTVTARRDLGTAGDVTWHSTLTRGLSWSTDGVAEEVARVTAELRSEYGSSAAGW